MAKKKKPKREPTILEDMLFNNKVGGLKKITNLDTLQKTSEEMITYLRDQQNLEQVDLRKYIKEVESIVYIKNTKW